FKERDRAFLDDLEFSLVAVGPTGRVEETDSGRVSLNVRPEIRQQIAGHGVRFLSRMALPPARYQLRVASREAGAGRASVVHYDLDVPDFTKEPLAISGLILTTASAGEAATPRGDAALRAVLPTPPTAVRTFTSRDVIVVFAEIYGGPQQAAQTLDITTTIRSANGADVFSAHAERSVEASTSVRTYPYGAEVPLKNLEPCVYVLRVEDRSHLGYGLTVFHVLPFEL